MSEDICKEDVRAYMRLWQGILLSQVQYAMSNINNGTARAKKLQARSLLTSYQPHFINACLLAGYNPDWFRQKCKQLFANHALREAEKMLELVAKSELPAAIITATWQPYFNDWNKLCKQKPIKKIKFNSKQQDSICTLTQSPMTMPTNQMRQASLLHPQEVLPLS